MAPSKSAGLVALLLVGLLVAIASARFQPPAPVAADAPATEFSAERAIATLTRLLGDETPHPVGSPANDRVRERVIGELEALGLTVETQDATSCSSRACARVRNVLARIPGEGEGPAVMLAAHYDSVPAGPGAGDDGNGVAIILETARAMLAAGPRRNPVILLIDDGEEVGLLGATAFAYDHPWAEQVGAVINVEARGTGGRSSMFQTSEGNAWLIDALADSVPAPNANSLAFEVYKRMPNDTDFTVFQRRGMHGLNFAFVGEVAHYHTPLDNLAHLDPGSVQHQGESVLAVATELATRDLDARSEGNSVYADILGFGIVRWPESWTLPISILAALGFVALVTVRVSRGEASVGQLLWGAATTTGLLVVPVLVVSGFAYTVEAAQGGSAPAFAHPVWLRIAVWSGVIATSAFIARTVGRRSGRCGVLAGVWMIWVALSVYAAAAVPGASAVFILPTLAGLAALGLERFVAPRFRDSLRLVGGAVALIIWLPLALALEDAFGWKSTPAVAGPIAFAMTAFAPVFCDAGSRFGLALRGLAALALVGLLGAVSVDLYSALRPQRIAVMQYDDLDAETSVVTAITMGDPLPPRLQEAAEFGESRQQSLPWLPWEVPTAATAPSGAEAPRAEVTSAQEVGDLRVVAARLTSSRGAPSGMVLIPADANVLSIEIDSQPVTPGKGIVGDWNRLSLFGLLGEGVELKLSVQSTEPVSVLLIDCVPALRGDAKRVADARGDTATTSQWGDGTCAGRRQNL